MIFKRFLSTLLAVLCLVSVLPFAALTAAEDASGITTSKPKVIMLVYDDSGSMSDADGRAVYAEYASRLLTAVLNEQDELYIKPLNHGSDIRVDLSNPSREAAISEAFSTQWYAPGGGTPIQEVRDANSFLRSKYDEAPDMDRDYYIVIMTDGEFTEGEGNHTLTADQLKNEVNEMLGNTATSKNLVPNLHIFYFAIGSEIVDLRGKIDDARFRAFAANNPKDLATVMSAVANNLTGRYTADTAACTVSNNKLTIDLSQFKYPLRNLAVMVQNTSGRTEIRNAVISANGTTIDCTADLEVFTDKPTLAERSSSYNELTAYSAIINSTDGHISNTGTLEISFSRNLPSMEYISIMPEPALLIMPKVSYLDSDGKSHTIAAISMTQLADALSKLSPGYRITVDDYVVYQYDKYGNIAYDANGQPKTIDKNDIFPATTSDVKISYTSPKGAKSVRLGEGFNVEAGDYTFNMSVSNTDNNYTVIVSTDFTILEHFLTPVIKYTDANGKAVEIYGDTLASELAKLSPATEICVSGYKIFENGSGKEIPAKTLFPDGQSKATVVYTAGTDKGTVGIGDVFKVRAGANTIRLTAINNKNSYTLESDVAFSIKEKESDSYLKLEQSEDFDGGHRFVFTAFENNERIDIAPTFTVTKNGKKASDTEVRSSTVNVGGKKALCVEIVPATAAKSTYEIVCEMTIKGQKKTAAGAFTFSTGGISITLGDPKSISLTSGTFASNTTAFTYTVTAKNGNSIDLSDVEFCQLTVGDQVIDPSCYTVSGNTVTFIPNASSMKKVALDNAVVKLVIAVDASAQMANDEARLTVTIVDYGITLSDPKTHTLTSHEAKNNTAKYFEYTLTSPGGFHVEFNDGTNGGTEFKLAIGALDLTDACKVDGNRLIFTPTHETLKGWHGSGEMTLTVYADGEVKAENSEAKISLEESTYTIIPLENAGNPIDLFHIDETSATVHFTIHRDGAPLSEAELCALIDPESGSPLHFTADTRIILDSFMSPAGLLMEYEDYQGQPSVRLTVERDQPKFFAYFTSKFFITPLFHGDRTVNAVLTDNGRTIAENTDTFFTVAQGSWLSWLLRLFTVLAIIYLIAVIVRLHPHFCNYMPKGVLVYTTLQVNKTTRQITKIVNADSQRTGRRHSFKQLWLGKYTQKEEFYEHTFIASDDEVYVRCPDDVSEPATMLIKNLPVRSKDDMSNRLTEVANKRGEIVSEEDLLALTKGFLHGPNPVKSENGIVIAESFDKPHNVLGNISHPNDTTFNIIFFFH